MSLSCLEHFQGSLQPVGESPGWFVWPSRPLMGTWAATSSARPALTLLVLAPLVDSHLRVLVLFPFRASLNTSWFWKILLKEFLPLTPTTLGSVPRSWTPVALCISLSCGLSLDCICLLMWGCCEFLESRRPCLNYLFPQAWERKLTHCRYHAQCVLMPVW